MKQKKPIIIISGATATGKTSTSILLAQELIKNGRVCEIVNFDSLLFYQELNIGTAKPTQEETQGIKHWLINTNSIKNDINAADFNRLCIEKISQLHSQGITPILTGGSAFYLRAIIKGMYESFSTPKNVKKEVELLIQEQGVESIREKLKLVDLLSFEKLHKNDHYRIVRAYEFFLSTGSPISEEKDRKDEENPYDFSKSQNENWEIHHIYLELPKLKHWELIEQRTKEMLECGLIEEVKGLLDSGYSGSEKPLGSIGYKETLSFINGEIKTHDELIEKIYFATRRLAKSQKTFFNKITPKNSYNPLTDSKEILSQAQAFLEHFC